MKITICFLLSADTKKPAYKLELLMVPGARLELARLCGRGILNPLCLPISPPGHGMYYIQI